MLKKYILVVALILTCSSSAQAWWFGNDKQEEQQQQTQQVQVPQQQQQIPQQTQQQNFPQQTQQRIPQQQNYNYRGRGSVTGLINRFPRSFDRGTLMRTGPGLLQETFFLFNRFKGNRNQAPQNQPSELPQNNPGQVPAPTAPQIPTAPVLYQEQEITPELPSPQQVLPLPENTETLKPELITEPSPEIKPTSLMLPAPQPGFIIRYNEEKGVYEEVREIKMHQPQQILPIIE